MYKVPLFNDFMCSYFSEAMQLETGIYFHYLQDILRGRLVLDSLSSDSFPECFQKKGEENSSGEDVHSEMLGLFPLLEKVQRAGHTWTIICISFPDGQ